MHLLSRQARHHGDLDSPPYTTGIQRAPTSGGDILPWHLRASPELQQYGMCLPHMQGDVAGERLICHLDGTHWGYSVLASTEGAVKGQMLRFQAAATRAGLTRAADLT